MNTQRIIDFALAKNGPLPEGYRVSFIEPVKTGWEVYALKTSDIPGVGLVCGDYPWVRIIVYQHELDSQHDELVNGIEQIQKAFVDGDVDKARIIAFNMTGVLRPSPPEPMPIPPREQIVHRMRNVARKWTREHFTMPAQMLEEVMAGIHSAPLEETIWKLNDLKRGRVLRYNLGRADKIEIELWIKMLDELKNQRKIHPLSK